MTDPSAKARAASYFEKKFDARKGCDLYLMCGEDTELMDEVIEELAEEFREAERVVVQAETKRCCEAMCPDCAFHIPLVESRAGTMIHQLGAMISQCKAAEIRALEVPL